jgi:hypothetical protein
MNQKTPDNRTQTDSKKRESKLSNFTIEMSNEKLDDLIMTGGYNWVNPRINADNFKFGDSLNGKWELDIYEPSKNLTIEEAKRKCMEGGWQPATLLHLLIFSKVYSDFDLKKPLVAPGSNILDDFEFSSSPVLDLTGNEKKLALGNWRGNRIRKHAYLRVRKITE